MKIDINGKSYNTWYYIFLISSYFMSSLIYIFIFKKNSTKVFNKKSLGDNKPIFIFSYIAINFIWHLIIFIYFIYILGSTYSGTEVSVIMEVGPFSVRRYLSLHELERILATKEFLPIRDILYNSPEKVLDLYYRIMADNNQETYESIRPIVDQDIKNYNKKFENGFYKKS
jgi:hypothetical protein